MHLPLQLPSPLQLLPLPAAAERRVEVWLKREDLIHPLLSGNKWRKLKYNLLAAKEQGASSILTFGGAWSNHIHATAAAGRLSGLNTIGIIRGEMPKQWSSTLEFAREQGMQLHFISRESYRQKENPEFIQQLRQSFGDFYLVPEGGNNEPGVKGSAEIAEEIQMPYDYLCTACGTGATLAGLARSAQGKKLMGFSALKAGDFLMDTVLRYAPEAAPELKIISDYSLGGYAKTTPALMAYIVEFHRRYAIRLDPVYTGKMMMGLEDLICRDYFAPGSVIVALHTGGLQGISGFPDLHKALFAR